jgi:hypothetical protein
VLGVAEVQIAAIVAVHGAGVPWGRLQVDGVTVAPARRVPDLLRALPPVLGPERVAWLANRARLRFRPVLPDRWTRHSVLIAVDGRWRGWLRPVDVCFSQLQRDQPYVNPYAPGCVPLASMAKGFCTAQSPFGEPAG